MNRLTLKLEALAPLDDADRRLLEEVTAATRRVPARTDLIREGDRPEDLHLVLEGFACRYKITDEGRRQIVAYLVPGDFCDLHVAVLGEMDHSIGTLSPCRIADVPQDAIERMLARPALARALWWATLVDEGVLREWLVTQAARPSPQRLAHLFAELLLRLRAVGQTEDGSYELPMTQEELGDTLGITTVHVNRSLKRLREDAVVTYHGGRVVIPDTERLFEYCGFNPNYLHRVARVEPRRVSARPSAQSSARVRQDVP